MWLKTCLPWQVRKGATCWQSCGPGWRSIYGAGPWEHLIRENRMMTFERKTCQYGSLLIDTELCTLPGLWEIMPWGCIIRFAPRNMESVGSTPSKTEPLNDSCVNWWSKSSKGSDKWVGVISYLRKTHLLTWEALENDKRSKRNPMAI